MRGKIDKLTGLVVVPDQLVAQMHRRLTEPDSHKAVEEARKEEAHA